MKNGTRRNRGKRIIVACNEINAEFFLEENDEESGDAEELDTGPQDKVCENPYLS